MNDYERIARVIRYLDVHYTEQPDLAGLADYAGLSPFHFHRLFSAWAGVTPKDFLQCLTLAHVKTRLLEGESVLDAALDAGLSGPGRLHDLCVSLEAVSPGEVKSGGEGLNIVYGLAETPFGPCMVGESQRGVCHFSFIDGERPDAAMAAHRSEWPKVQFSADDAEAARVTAAMFARPGHGGDRPRLRAFVKGTAFQLRVWRALLRVPTGSLVSYGRLAAAVGQPAAARAVGGALGRNALAFLIPCHRVIQETGAVGKYRWGALRKRAMIAWESTAKIRKVGTIPV